MQLTKQPKAEALSDGGHPAVWEEKMSEREKRSQVPGNLISCNFGFLLVSEEGTLPAFISSESSLAFSRSKQPARNSSPLGPDFILNRLIFPPLTNTMPGSSRSSHGVDSGVHPPMAVPRSRIGSTGGCPTGATFEHCGYCTQVHQDPHIQNLYPLKPEQHMRGNFVANGDRVQGQAAGKPTELFASSHSHE
ncbi:hypothetical protein cyc_02325 [Cyclospora cayetanensis]|uniref:Uncharacterized protein n=1 Tax=Cyclospora cayetanensis TaxID=88456 RepID=A0A1D3D6A4_9EIME|nr:hypothetical protein cyc_02325 [Cyclospora cayetanensis]